MAAVPSDKPILAVDLDEVLGSFVRSLNQFHNERYGTMYRESDYFSYHFSDVWGCTDAEAVDRVHAFFASDAFANIQPVQSAAEALGALAERFRLVVVTSRQLAVKDATEAWLTKTFPGVFEAVHFANHYAADGSPSRSKAEICKAIGAVAIVDDSRHHAIECAKAGVPCVVLFGEYAWNRPSLAGAAEAAGAGAAGADAADSLSTRLENVHLCSEWWYAKSVLERLSPAGRLAPVPSLWVRGGSDEVPSFRSRAFAVLTRQETLAVTAVGVSIAPLLAVVGSLKDAGLAEVAQTVSGLDAAYQAGADRMPRLTVTLRRTAALMDEAEARERAIAEQADAFAAAAAEAAKASATA